MRSRLSSALSLSLALALAAGGCGSKSSEPTGAAKPADGAAAAAGFDLEPVHRMAFKKLPAVYEAEGVVLTDALVELGRKLYHDPRLSKGQDVSCNTCHLVDKAGVDGLPTSKGHKGQVGTRNAPTTLNAAGHFVQFWDGRAESVEEQAKGPILNPVEMALPTQAACNAVVASIPGYQEEFKKAFPGEASPINYDNIGKAIGAFERKLVAPSRWDAYLGGDKSALTEAEKRGAVLFVTTGCVTCHAGPHLGGNDYKVLGLVRKWPNEKDVGRFEITKDPADRMVFKVPTLRNVTRTGPYFHDGGVASLNEAVKLMAAHQLGKDLTSDEVDGIVAFLKALEGDPPKELMATPTLPPSGPDTPKPDNS